MKSTLYAFPLLSKARTWPYIGHFKHGVLNSTFSFPIDKSLREISKYEELF